MSVTVRRVFSGGVTQSNTPETDKMPMVMHFVSGEVGDEAFTVKLMAREPLDAMDRVRSMSDAEFAALERVDE